MYIVLSGLNSFLELSWLLVAILFLWLLGFGFQDDFQHNF